MRPCLKKKSCQCKTQESHITGRKAGGRPVHITACNWQAVLRARAGKVTQLICQVSPSFKRGRQMEWAVSRIEFRTHPQAKGRSPQKPRAKAKRALQARLPGRVCREQQCPREFFLPEESSVSS